MPQNSSSSDDSTDRTEPPATIDTDVAAAREKVSHAPPGEPFVIDIAFRAVTLRRIDLERRSEKTFAGWIRDTVTARLEYIEGEDPPTGDNHPRSRPADYTPANDTADEDITECVSFADPGDWVSVSVEFPAGVLDAVIRESEDTAVCEWIRTAVRIRFSMIDHGLSITPTVRVEIPDEIAVRAQLAAKYRVATDPSREYHRALREALFELVQTQPEYLVGGEPIASVGDADPSADASHPRGEEEQ